MKNVVIVLVALIVVGGAAYTAVRRNELKNQELEIQARKAEASQKKAEAAKKKAEADAKKAKDDAAPTDGLRLSPTRPCGASNIQFER